MILLNLSHYPEALQLAPAQLAGLQQLLQSSSTQNERDDLDRLVIGETLQQFHKILIGSRFAAEQLCKCPQWLIELISQNHLVTPWSKSHYQDWFQQDQTLSPEPWNKHLRLQRNKAMVRIIWRDFNRLASTQETIAELSFMAEAAIQSTLDYHYHHLSEELGLPLDDTGNVQGMLILGMGKLGAWELNLSSDVDLIFSYPNNGQTSKNNLSNQEFFARLGQKIIQSLDQNTADGFVFRVDMRLRPYGQSGALVSNFNALEDYYQTQGREWERFAMIKARVVASTETRDAKMQTRNLMKLLRSFTYRGYVDFTAIEALRDLKQRIQREVKRRKLGSNVKLGSGGIREVEFIAQAFQIIRGGRDTELQNPQLLIVLPLLCKLNCLPQGVDQQLAQAYIFLRNTEHAIQGYDDKQSQDLPQDDRGLSRIAFILGFSDSASFLQQLKHHRNTIEQQFSAVVDLPDEAEDKHEQQELKNWKHQWQSLSAPSIESKDSEQDPMHHLAELGLEPTPLLLQTVKSLLSAPSVLAMDSLSHTRFNLLMPSLLKQLAQMQAPDETLARLSPLLIAIARRSAYLLLLIESPAALNQLLILSHASPWIAEELSQHPALLDELLNPAVLYAPPKKQELAQELRECMLRVAEDDQEGQMEGLRYFRKAHSLKVAACEITGKMPLMKVSDYLSELAEVICEYVLNLAWIELSKRHGYPDCNSNQNPNFIIVAYGKLGGIELGHDSDLDLVFIHDASSTGRTSGVISENTESPQRSIDNYTFYTRLGQKIIHYLNTRTPAGQLYEVDMRLRPSGNSGLLTTSLDAYQRYQLNDAWTWEHQALVRSRAIAGCNQLKAKFAQIRQQVLTLPRPLDQLKKDVIEMRQKMRTQLGSTKKQQAENLFHLKQDEGGIVDIEFMVQYAVLAWSHTEPSLTQYSDNIRILEGLENKGLLLSEEVEQLTAIYKTYRTKGHRLALQQQPSLIPTDELLAERQVVMGIWHRMLEEPNTHIVTPECQ